MLRLVPDIPPPSAYLVPLHIDRSRAPVYHLSNDGTEELRGISLTLLGAGVLLAGIPSRLQPGDFIEFTLRGDDLARSSVVIVRWFRPRGNEYLWRVSF
ncbi:MAG: hypothetical protein ABI400_06870 [Lacisediminihabitans sp.]